MFVVSVVGTTLHASDAMAFRIVGKCTMNVVYAQAQVYQQAFAIAQVQSPTVLEYVAESRFLTVSGTVVETQHAPSLSHLSLNPSPSPCPWDAMVWPIVTLSKTSAASVLATAPAVSAVTGFQTVGWRWMSATTAVDLGSSHRLVIVREALRMCAAYVVVRGLLMANATVQVI